MVKVAGIRFRAAGKTYYFDPCGLGLKKGAGVIVETARGMEYGEVSMEVTEVAEKDVVAPLKKIVRVADANDIRWHEENEAKKGDAMRLCRDKIAKHGLDMKLIDVEYTFDNNKIIFYFTADGRVDFRDLVRDLAGQFKMRIELRQVGVRDEAKMLGGIGCCGRPLCCATWMKDFQPVSIKMTKTQNLSLNPAKISGVCGRLMCCLKYENDVYLELRKNLPSVGERVQTEEGLAKVIESNVLAGTVKVRTFTGERDDNGREKLSSEVYTFAKEDVERLKLKGIPQGGKKDGNSGEGKERPAKKEKSQNHKEHREGRENRESKENREPKEKREPKAARFPKEPVEGEAREGRDGKDGNEAKEGSRRRRPDRHRRRNRNSGEGKNAGDGKSPKEGAEKSGRPERKEKLMKEPRAERPQSND